MVTLGLTNLRLDPGPQAIALLGTILCSPTLPPFSLLKSGFRLDGPSDLFFSQAVSQKFGLRHLMALSLLGEEIYV